MTNHSTPTIFKDAPTEAILARHPNARIALIRFREAAHLPRAELARRIGLSRFVVFRVEVGRSETVLPTMERWVAALGRGASFDLFRKGVAPWPELRRLRRLRRKKSRNKSRKSLPHAEPRP